MGPDRVFLIFSVLASFFILPTFCMEATAKVLEARVPRSPLKSLVPPFCSYSSIRAMSRMGFRDSYYFTVGLPLPVWQPHCGSELVAAITECFQTEGLTALPTIMDKTSKEFCDVRFELEVSHPHGQGDEIDISCIWKVLACYGEDMPRPETCEPSELRRSSLFSQEQ